MKIRRVVVIVTVLAGIGYKVTPLVWHKVEARPEAKVQAKAGTAPAIQNGTVTNAAGVRLSACDLGAVSLTNHCETCVSLGQGKDCLLTPTVIDKNNIQLTLAVESKKANGRIHDLSITQVVTKPGKTFDVAVGNFSFSLTPNIITE